MFATRTLETVSQTVTMLYGSGFRYHPLLLRFYSACFVFVLYMFTFLSAAGHIL